MLYKHHCSFIIKLDWKQKHSLVLLFVCEFPLPVSITGAHMVTMVTPSLLAVDVCHVTATQRVLVMMGHVTPRQGHVTATLE